VAVSRVDEVGALVGCFGDDIAAAVDEIVVIAQAAEQAVIARGAVQGVVAGKTNQGVGGGVADQVVIELIAGARQRRGLQRQVFEVGAQGAVDGSKDGVGATIEVFDDDVGGRVDKILVDAVAQRQDFNARVVLSTSVVVAVASPMVALVAALRLSLKVSVDKANSR